MSGGGGQRALGLPKPERRIWAVRSPCSASSVRLEALATSTDLSIRQIQSKIAGRASRGMVGEITIRVRAAILTVTTV